jgi:glutathione synthase
MRIAFVVNDRREPSVEQTTTLLISAALRRGHEVFVCGVGDLSSSDDAGLSAHGCIPDESDPAALVRQLSEAESARRSLEEHDLCIVRTNPARDGGRRTQHLAAIRLLASLEERGIPVINSPQGLLRALTKLSLLDLPASLRPRTLVTRDASAIERFLENEPDRIVIKPLEGTRGRDVFMLERTGSRTNAKQIIDVVLRQGYAMVQEFVPGAERGDVRATVVAGEILEVDGRAAAVARVPDPSDFRSNLHAGGTAEMVEVSVSIREAVARIAPHLDREGLLHVGVDFVGGKILELNVFSPGGLHPSERLYGRDFSGAVIAAFERCA